MATKRSMRGFRFEGSLIGRLHVRKGGVRFFLNGFFSRLACKGLTGFGIVEAVDDTRISGSQNMGTQIIKLWSASAALKTNLFPIGSMGLDVFTYT